MRFRRPVFMAIAEWDLLSETSKGYASQIFDTLGEAKTFVADSPVGDGTASLGKIYAGHFAPDGDFEEVADYYYDQVERQWEGPSR